MHISNVKTTVN